MSMKNLIAKAKMALKSKTEWRGECLIWTGGCDRDGYERLKLNYRDWHAHRLAYTVINGPIPDGHVIRHSCDVPACCNPDHLLIGTQQDNMDDRSARDRTAKGETHGNAKLTETEVMAIYKDTRLHRVIAAEYGVVEAAISAIKRGVVWKHVTGLSAPNPPTIQEQEARFAEAQARGTAIDFMENDDANT